jgi:hypothetical protein
MEMMKKKESVEITAREKEAAEESAKNPEV